MQTIDPLRDLAGAATDPNTNSTKTILCKEVSKKLVLKLLARI